jgi:tricorn protease
VPKQLTFYPARGPLPDRWGYDNQVLGWSSDGSHVVFRSLRDGWSPPMSRLYMVKASGGPAFVLPIPNAGSGDFNADLKKMAYSPLFRDFRTWKRYEGGWAQDLWVIDFPTGAARNLTNHPRTDRDPMWIGDRIWFASDRTGTLNLWSIPADGGEARMETSSERWDVRWPSKADDARVVYELGGELFVRDCVKRTDTKLAISVPSEGLAARPSHVTVDKNVEGMALAPHGERALVVARGDVYTVPIEHGPVRNLTRSSGAHDKHAAWSPDGRKVAFVSDKSGEEQVWLADQDGSGEPQQLTTTLEAMLYAPEWSPDGKHLAFSDKDGKLFVLEVATKALVQVADEERGQLRDYAWSPGSDCLAFTLTRGEHRRVVVVWSRRDKALHEVTATREVSSQPAWDPKGERLFFLGNRSYAPRISSLEFNYAVDRQTGVFAIALRKGLPSVLPPRSDEVKVEGAASQPSSQPATATASASAPASSGRAIDWDGIVERVEMLPIAFDNYAALDAVEGGLVYMRSPAFYYGREPDTKPALLYFDWKDRKQTEISEGLSGFTVSADKKKLLVREGASLYLQDATAGGKSGRKTVSLQKLEYDRVPQEEWLQIFDEVWRRYRDFFYAENMHGYDWEALRAQYRPLVAQVAHRADLNYVIGEMIAELNVGHAYISGGEWAQTERPRYALPGARFVLDMESGRFKLGRILRGQNDDPKYRSPLTEVGVDVAEGQYVLAIDGEELRGDEDPYRLLRHKGDQPTALLVNDKPTREGAREVRYRGVASESDLLYFEYVRTNRERVEKLSEGKVGYLHVPDMGENGIREWIKSYYALLDKDGLIVDDRWNGGGNISRMLIERLRRVLLMGGFPRTGAFQPYPDGTFQGHLVCLLNECSASDGDIFPAMFKRAKLGPLVGKRSWGGIVGITNRGSLLDGGVVNVPEFANTELDGRWTIEGHGVDPDFVVENDPAALLAGRDPQLEKAVELALDAIRKRPVVRPTRPPLPVKR